MIINFFGVQLQIIDNGDGTFSVKPVDAEADKQAIRDELSRLKAEKQETNANIEDLNEERDTLLSRKDEVVAARLVEIAERDVLNIRIQELRDFLVGSGDPDPGV